MEWQPIETAPKYVKIILSSPYMGVGQGTVCVSSEASCANGFPVGSLIGIMSVSNEWGEYKCSPTHWMPLPEPPK